MPTDLRWTTEQRKVSDLVAHPHNPRTMTEKEDADLQASIETFDLVEIPAVNLGDNMIIAGHQRVRKLLEQGRGDETIDVRVPSRPLTRDEVDQYLIRSNKNTGGWDWDMLANVYEIEDLREWGFSEFEFDGRGLSDFFPDGGEKDEEYTNKGNKGKDDHDGRLTCPACGETITECNRCGGNIDAEA